MVTSDFTEVVQSSKTKMTCVELLVKQLHICFLIQDTRYTTSQAHPRTSTCEVKWFFKKLLPVWMWPKVLIGESASCVIEWSCNVRTSCRWRKKKKTHSVYRCGASSSWQMLNQVKMAAHVNRYVRKRFDTNTGKQRSARINRHFHCQLRIQQASNNALP